MKIQSLAIIFIIIIMPITMVLSEYVNNKVITSKTELEYDTRLLNSTYDAIKAYQINTINNANGDVTNSKINDIEAAATTFYNSLASNFNYTGYRTDIMKDYVPAIAFTMYDGYYIHSPFNNTLTEVKSDDYDPKYSKDGEMTEGLKPYVYYSCRYKRGNNDIIITYTLDNFITIRGLINGDYDEKSGYLYSIDSTNGLSFDGQKAYQGGYGPIYQYTYNGISFRNDVRTSYGDSYREELTEYVGDKKYSYVKINGKKYYLDTANSDGIFYIDSNGEKNYSQATDDSTKTIYKRAIKMNMSAYEYYKNAYDFSKFVKENFGDLTYGDIVEENTYGTTSIKDSASSSTKIFDFSDIEYSTSSFNQHRKAVIRYVIETNLATAISGFSSNATSNFIMPKISETDWEIIEDNVCAISFLQGMNIGAKKYNGYSVIANTLTKEYIDENDIYILGTAGTYFKANDKNIAENSSNIPGRVTLGHYAGIWKINFEQKRDISSGTTKYYFPINYLGSYTSIMGNSGMIETSIGNSKYPDMYTYLNEFRIAKGDTNSKTLREAYYYALGRERWGSFNINNIDWETYGNNSEEYFLKTYKW